MLSAVRPGRSARRWYASLVSHRSTGTARFTGRKLSWRRRSIASWMETNSPIGWSRVRAIVFLLESPRAIAGARRQFGRRSPFHVFLFAIGRIERIRELAHELGDVTQL